MANVNFYRDTKANIDNVAYTDGQMYFPTDQNKIYLDTGNQRKQYGGDTEVDSALSTTSTNPVQNNIVTTSLNQKVAKTDVVNDLDSAMAVTAIDVPVGCGAIKELNESLTAPTVGMFIYDYKDGKYGYNTDPSRGADTFFPFRGETQHIFQTYYKSSFGSFTGQIEDTITKDGTLQYRTWGFNQRAASASFKTTLNGATISNSGSIEVNAGDLIAFHVTSTDFLGILVLSGCVS